MGINRRWGSWWLISCGHVHVGDMCGIGNVEGTLVTMVVAARELRRWGAMAVVALAQVAWAWQEGC